jgi:hypothetical protein
VDKPRPPDQLQNQIRVEDVDTGRTGRSIGMDQFDQMKRVLDDPNCFIDKMETIITLGWVRSDQVS